MNNDYYVKMANAEPRHPVWSIAFVSKDDHAAFDHVSAMLKGDKAWRVGGAVVELWRNYTTADAYIVATFTLEIKFVMHR